MIAISVANMEWTGARHSVNMDLPYQVRTYCRELMASPATCTVRALAPEVWACYMYSHSKGVFAILGFGFWALHVWVSREDYLGHDRDEFGIQGFGLRLLGFTCMVMTGVGADSTSCRQASNSSSL